MQRNGCRINEVHINTIALKARLDNRECGYLWKRSADSGGKWQNKWFALYQHFLFYYENVNSTKPLGLILLESCYCNRIVADTKNTKEGEIKLFCFSISYSKDGKNSIEFGAENEQECNQWIESINNCSYNKQVSLYAQLQEKYSHLTQLYETESKLKWEYLSQVERLSEELLELREKLKGYKGQQYIRQKSIADEESADLKRIKKVQSLCKGWLYRKRWKRIVRDYIESPHAMNLRKRNRIVFELVEKEGEYMSQLEILVSNFLRPFKMAASSSKAPITHEEINCIFLNSEILLFLHQIFYKGLTRKLDNWPTLFIGDLFDFLLPVLVIYQEYVRNHHYSLQILTELKSRSIEFRNLLKRCEEKSKCEGRSLDVFLTYPMHQIPRYILVLHQLIAHTSPSSHNELKSLENAKIKLEELSRIMRDEVSETENIRCNLAIEKLIVEGCECLFDPNQLFIREGLLIILSSFKSKTLGVKVKDAKKRNVVKCFLFTNHLIVTTRASNGRLNLFKPYEAIPLSECKLEEELTCDVSLIEETESTMSTVSDDCSISSSSAMSVDSTSSLFYNKDNQNDYSCEFKLLQTNNNFHRSIHFVASSLSEKQSWCGDISQCIDNLNYSSLLQNTNTSNSVNMPNKATHIDDPTLFNDEKDVKYCKTFNSCKVPQIRHATVEKLLERLTDLRFLSIDFLNTFLLTYRVFTDAFTVLNALVALYESSPRQSFDIPDGETQYRYEFSNNELSRRVSVTGHFRLPSINEENFTSSRFRNVSSYSASSKRDLDLNNLNIDNSNESNCKKSSFLKEPISRPLITFGGSSTIKPSSKLAPIASCETMNCESFSSSSGSKTDEDNKTPTKMDSLPCSKSANDIIENVLNNAIKVNVTDGILKRDTQNNKISLLSTQENGLNNSKNSEDVDINCNNSDDDSESEYAVKFSKSALNSMHKFFASSNSSLNDSISSALSTTNLTNLNKESKSTMKLSKNNEALALSPANLRKLDYTNNNNTNTNTNNTTLTTINTNSSKYILTSIQQNAQKLSKKLTSLNQNKSYIRVTDNPNKKLPISVYAGVVVTSSRVSRRRISNCEATKAFAVATSGSQQSLDKTGKFNESHLANTNRAERLSSSTSDYQKTKNDWVIVNTAASMRVLNVLRHWITKHPLDFSQNQKLKEDTLQLVLKIFNDSQITETEKKVATCIIQQLNAPNLEPKMKIEILLAKPITPGKAKFCDLSVSEIAEQMTYIDYQIFCSISSQELLGQAWMKPGKEIKAKNVLLFSKRFNEMSQLVVTEIVRSTNHIQRLEKLEKWTTIANICKFLKNFNGVLQIMSAFASTSVFRLRKTWEKLSKNNQETIDTLQTLVSSDGRFKNLRDAMNKCDPPCIPYLGMYLMDLVFIEESTPDFIEGNLINFSKLRMVSHIIRDIRTFQQSKYTIHYNKRVCDFLLDTSDLLTPDEAYNKSLSLEPRSNFVSRFGDSI